MFWTIIFTLCVKMYIYEAKIGVLYLGFNSGIYDKTIQLLCNFFHLILALLKISWKKKLRKNPIILPKLLEYSPLN